MVRLTRERVAQLSRDLLESLVRDNTVVLLKDRDAVRQAIAAALAEEFRREEDREQLVRRRIATTPGAPPNGTRDYDLLFRKLLEDEYVRESLDS